MKNTLSASIAICMLLASVSSSAQTSLNNLYFAPGGNIGIGIASPQSTLAVNGIVTTQKLIVTPNGWSDFVFNKDYRLPGMEQLRQFIAEHKHLPGIISADEVKKKGLDVGENEAALLQKIEELTLYLLQQDQALQRANDLNKKLAAEDQQLEARFTRLEEEVQCLKKSLAPPTR